MRRGAKEYRQFVGIARGSAGEVCYQLLAAHDSKYISNDITKNQGLVATASSKCSPACPGR
jgi:four helix bundle protein